MATLTALQGLSSRGIVNLDNAEGVLQQIIDQVNAQAALIMNLTAMVQTLSSKDEMAGAMLRVEDSMSRIEQRVAAIEKSIHIPGLERSVPIGEVVGSHSLALSRATESLAKKADLSEVTAQFVAIQQSVQDDLAKVYQWGASKESFQWLEDAHHASHQKLLAVEQAMACKLDKVDLSQMETALSRLRGFNIWCDDTGRRLQRLESGLERTGKALQDESLSSRMVESRVVRLETELQNRTTRDEMGQMVGELRSLARVVGDKADGDDMRQARRDLEAHQQEIKGLQEGFMAWREENVSVLEELNKELQNTASLEQLHRKLDARTFDRHWKSLLSAIEKKADELDMQGINTRLTRAEEGLASTSKEADVAIKFVTWFTRRGEAYEHNLHTLDRTIGRLGVNSLPSRREPYDGRVRFTPLEPDLTINIDRGLSTQPRPPASTSGGGISPPMMTSEGVGMAAARRGDSDGNSSNSSGLDDIFVS